MHEIEEWLPAARTAGLVEADLDDLAELLVETVRLGASVNFIHPFGLNDGRKFWAEKVLPDVRARETRAFVARLEGRIVGTVLLGLAMPPNQRHRASVNKMLVHPRARRRGIGRALMRALEVAAKEENRSLLTLDTRTDSEAEPLYVSMGFKIVGVVPRFALHADGEILEAATFMYKELSD